MQSYSIRIPAKPYIAKFAARRYGNPVGINNSTALSALIRGLLHKPGFDIKHSTVKENLRLKYFTGHILCEAPLSQMPQIGYALTTDHIIQINAFLEEDFKERLQLFVAKTANWEARRSGIDQAIEAFAAYYSIQLEEEITFDGLKKMEYRARTAPGRQSFPTKISMAAHYIHIL